MISQKRNWQLLMPLVLPAVMSFSLRAAEPGKIPGIGPLGEVVRIGGDFQFTEGPAQDSDGILYFTDIPAERIYRLGRDGRTSVFLEPSGHANGLMFDAAGKLIACQMDGRLVAMDAAAKQITPLAEEYDGRRFNAPNDLVIDRAGGVYFTDPRFRAPEPWPQGVEAVYYRAADGRVARLIDDVPTPNGVILSPDEKTLYVIPSMQQEMLACEVRSPGILGPKRIFCRLAQPDDAQPGRGGGGDGLSIDTAGNLYITSALGIQVFNPEGELLGIIAIPEKPANVTFGGPDRRTLYVTARTSLYAVKTQAVGHVFPGVVPLP